MQTENNTKMIFREKKSNWKKVNILIEKRIETENENGGKTCLPNTFTMAIPSFVNK